MAKQVIFFVEVRAGIRAIDRETALRLLKGRSWKPMPGRQTLEEKAQEPRRLSNCA